MIAYFSLVLDLLQLDVDRKKYEAIAERMITLKGEEMLFFHRHAFLFSAFWQLIHDEIDVGAFTQI